MKALVGILITFGLVYAASSCTFPKGDCMEGDANLINTIYFINFTQQEVDTIYLICYRANSDFTWLLDSSVIFGFKYDSIRAFANTSHINIDLEYKITMKKTGQVFKLSGFTTKKAICKQGILSHYYYNKLSGYYINGEQIRNSNIEIYNK